MCACVCFVCVCLFPAALHSPVYRYVVTHTPSRAVNSSEGLWSFPSRFSFHGLDSFAFFGGLEKLLGGPLSAQDTAFQKLLTEHLVHFAKEGERGAGAGTQTPLLDWLNSVFIQLRPLELDIYHIPFLISLSLTSSLLFSPSLISFPHISIPLLSSVRSIPHLSFCSLHPPISSSVLSIPLSSSTAGKMPEQWSEYPAATALLNHTLSVVHDYSAERCQLWEKNGFYPYAWVN